MNSREKGQLGEEIACNYLKKNGVKIIDRNYLTKYGEIDLIGFEKKTIIFIEVKLRNNRSFGLPVEGISDSKKRRIYNAALYYLSNNNIDYRECRFDILSILFSVDSFYKIEWYKEVIF